MRSAYIGGTLSKKLGDQTTNDYLHHNQTNLQLVCCVRVVSSHAPLHTTTHMKLFLWCHGAGSVEWCGVVWQRRATFACACVHIILCTHMQCNYTTLHNTALHYAMSKLRHITATHHATARHTCSVEQCRVM